MKIIRAINGKDVEFELTSAELYSAYEEYEHIFDKADIKDIIDQMDDETLMEYYGISKHTADGLVDAMAYRMRRYIDKYDISLSSARDEAIQDIICEYKK